MAIVFWAVVSGSQSFYNIGRYLGDVLFPARFSASAPKAFFSSVDFFCQPCGLTKRAPDAGESGAIPSLFLRLSIFPVGRRSAARPSAGNANRWVAETEIHGDIRWTQIQC